MYVLSHALLEFTCTCHVSHKCGRCL